MFRISKNSHNIISILIRYDVGGEGSVDSLFIIPGVTYYKNIYSIKNYLVLENDKSSVSVEFKTEADLEKFFIQLIRDIKIDKIINK
jgi:hypothetical protein